MRWMMFFKDSRVEDDPTSWRKRLDAINEIQKSLKADGYGPPRIIYAKPDGRHSDRGFVPTAV